MVLALQAHTQWTVSNATRAVLASTVTQAAPGAQLVRLASLLSTWALPRAIPALLASMCQARAAGVVGLASTALQVIAPRAPIVLLVHMVHIACKQHAQNAQKATMPLVLVSLHV